MAGWGRNDDAESMTHPTAGICGIMHQRTRQELDATTRHVANVSNGRGVPRAGGGLTSTQANSHRADISVGYPSRSAGLLSTKIFSGFWRLGAGDWGLRVAGNW